jgi:acylphosphatase
VRSRAGNPLERMNRSRLQVLYSGKVQGVGFRYLTRQLAMEFEVTGQVRNLDDGRVELLAEGEKAELEAFRQAVRESGLGPLIRREEVFWSGAGDDGDKFRGFEIVSR